MREGGLVRIDQKDRESTVSDERPGTCHAGCTRRSSRKRRSRAATSGAQALKWEEVVMPADGGAGSAVLRRSVVELAGEPPKIRNTTKTGKPRSVPLLPEVVASLKSHRLRQNEERLKISRAWEDNALVFPTTTGTVMSRSNLSRHHFKPIFAEAELSPDTRPYDLRHTFATLWMESGEDGKLLQRVLGHSRYETTANRYVHPSDRATGGP